MTSSAAVLTNQKPDIQLDDDVRPDESDRYRIYTRDIDGKKIQLADTSLQGIGLCIKTLHDEGQLSKDDPVGIRDRVEHTWLVNPWARGRRT